MSCCVFCCFDRGDLETFGRVTWLGTGHNGKVDRPKRPPLFLFVPVLANRHSYQENNCAHEHCDCSDSHEREIEPSSPAVAEGVIYFGSFDGNVYALR